MALAPRLELRQAQQLVMTPQLQLAIKLLTLTNVELETYISEQLDQNPLLSAAPGDEDMPPPALKAEPPEPDASLEPVEGDPQNLVAASRELFAGTSALPDNDGPDFDRFAGPEASLSDLLLAQAGLALHGPDLLIAQLLIDHVDEAGYLTLPLEEAARLLGVSLQHIEAVLATLQTFEPSGVFARSLAECIAIQAREADRYDPAMAALIDHLDLVARSDIPALMRVTGQDREDVLDMIRELRSYDPRPGLRYSSEPATPVIADVLVSRAADGAWRVDLNQANLPRLIIDRDYHATLAAGAPRATTGFLNDCLSEANWLVRALDQRARTIVKVAGEIVRHQQGFFEHGVACLKPLTLRQIADTIGMHESTVSRVTANKYLACERGLYELKWFFASGISAGTGDAASHAVKDRIARLIANEGDNVLSDDALVDLLQAEGFDIARRTVAKYREALGLGSSVARRRARTLAAA
jgi:RNA polymerase sigma-54 factor